MTDPGFSGVTVTDNCRTWLGKLHRWADHQQRFRRDCESCFVPLSGSDSEITSIALRIISENTKLINDDLHLITFATPGSFGLMTRPVDRTRNRRFFSEGVTLKVVGHQPVDAAAILSPRWKHRSRMVWHIAEKKAHPAVAVLLDRPDGTLTETAIASVLAVIDGVLVTPPRHLILDGISLKITLELAEANGIHWQEREIRRDDWLRASEMMLAGTGFGIAGVKRIDDAAIPWPGSAYHKLLDAWSNEVGCDIGAIS